MNLLNSLEKTDKFWIKPSSIPRLVRLSFRLRGPIPIHPASLLQQGSDYLHNDLLLIYLLLDFADQYAIKNLF